MNIYDLRSDDSDSMLKFPLGWDLTLQILTISRIDIANSGTISVYNPFVNMIPWKANLSGVDFFLLLLLYTNDLPVVQLVSSSIKDSSNKIVICEVLLGVRKRYSIFWQVKTAKTLKFTYKLPFVYSNHPPFWIWPAHVNRDWQMSNLSRFAKRSIVEFSSARAPYSIMACRSDISMIKFSGVLLQRWLVDHKTCGTRGTNRSYTFHTQ